MKKRNAALIITLVAAVALFGITVAASGNPYNGYETFKEVMKNNHEVANGTIEGTITLTDNGKVTGEFTGTMKMDEEAQKMSGDFSLVIDDLQRTGQVFGDQETKVFVDTQNDLYYQIQQNGKVSIDEMSWKHESKEQEMTKEQEALLDLLVNDYKADFVLSDNADGTQSVTFALSEDELPAALNLLVSAAASKEEQSTQEKVFFEQHPQIPFFDGFKNSHELMPHLVTDIKIKGLESKVTFDENMEIQAMAFELAVEGKDNAGVQHDLIVKGQFQIKNAGTTVVDSVDLTGKSVEAIEIPDHPKGLKHQ